MRRWYNIKSTFLKAVKTLDEKDIKDNGYTINDFYFIYSDRSRYFIQMFNS